MKEPSKNPVIINDELKHDLKVIISISLALFLFILFFQPFELNHLAFNNKLLFIAGLGTITFLVMVFFHSAFPNIWPRFFKTSEWENEPVYLISGLIWIISSAAYAFYIRYVGSVELSMFLMFKIIIICFVPVAVLQFYDKYRALRHQVSLLHESLTKLSKTISKYEKDTDSKHIEIYSENRSEKMNLPLVDLAFIRSADNYIEIVYKEHEQFKKRLIRNTLRNAEEMLSLNPDFIRCHRTCIVNKHLIDKIVHNYTGQKIVIKGYDKEIPVSRQYILLVKEAISKQ
ncbi:MAG: response regulator transcription factor [Bacteroidales bacterium]|nr:response regulator transcription factor [Bacteroidales bacterium]MBN2764139.1 response regulator transcription factor [Bacteroidales bacterium]